MSLFRHGSPSYNRLIGKLTLLGFFVAVGAPLAKAADITVGSPVNGSKLSSPILIRAHTTGCNGLAPVAFGYSLDSSSGLVLGDTPYDIDDPNDPIAAGAHTIYFKAWTAKGLCPVVSTTFSVGATSPFGIPSYAISSGDLDASKTWYQGHDGGTPGTSTGSTAFPVTTPAYDDARRFFMTYTARAGERWATYVATDRVSTHFVLDTYVMFPNPSQILNLELDVNQTLANGNTVILGTQCSGVTKRWAYAWTVGPHLDHWWSTNLPCDPATWTPNVWHHVQIGMHHDANGVVTHDWVTLDGVTKAFTDSTRMASHFLQWAPGITNTQFQIEGTSTAKSTLTAYAHKLTVYRW